MKTTAVVVLLAAMCATACGGVAQAPKTARCVVLEDRLDETTLVMHQTVTCGGTTVTSEYDTLATRN